MPNPKSKSLTFIPGKGYHELVKFTRNALEALDRAIRRQTALAAWKLGRNAYKHLKENEDKSGYGTGFYVQFSQDIGRDISTVQRAVQFYLAYPISAVRRELTWDHYRALIPIKDKDERKKIEEKIVQFEWTSAELQNYLRNKRQIRQIKTIDASIPKLKCERGFLYTYPMVKETTLLEFPDRLYVDYGFHNRHWLDFSPGKYKEGDIVETLKSHDGRYSLKASDRQKKDLYTFKAVVNTLRQERRASRSKFKQHQLLRILFSSLLLDVFLNHLAIPSPTYRRNIISICPKFPSP
ncbi:MAG: DUF1016 N-terminal domain-containing protein [Candidatus Margulisiibacteriota bacterium]